MNGKTLFETFDQPGRIALSSNFSIYPLFSRGCLFPPVFELGEDYDFPTPHGTNFILFERAIPEVVVKSMEASARNLVPIGIVFKKSAVINSNHHVTDFITLCQVERLVFRTEKELKRFKHSPFADVDMEAIEIEMVEDATLFAGQTDGASLASIDEADTVDTQAKAIRVSDAFAGLCCSLLTHIPGKISQFEMLTSLLDAERNSPVDEETAHIATIAGSCLDNIEKTNQGWESSLLSIASRELLSLNPNEGWAAKQILTRIAGSASAEMAGSDGTESLELLRRWTKVTMRVLDDETTLPPLGDSGGSLILRALCLLLVRGSTESLLALHERHREERVGPKVWRLSFALAALHEGLRSLPKELKYRVDPPEVSRARMEVLGTAARLCKAKLDRKPASIPTPSLSVVQIDVDKQRSIALKVNDLTIATSAVDVHPALRKAANDCRYYGFEVGEPGAEYFEVSSGVEQSLQGTIQVSVWYDPSSGSEVLRFQSTAKTLKTTAAMAGKDPVKFLEKSTQLNKSDLLAMLISNSDVRQNCRVALQTNPLAIVVIVDQMLDTMDRAECVAHLNNVSKTAAELREVLSG